MATPRLSPKEEFARRGDAISEEKNRPHLKPRDKGKYVAIDIETREYEMSKSEMASCRRLRARIPDVQIDSLKVGYPAVHIFRSIPHQETLRLPAAQQEQCLIVLQFGLAAESLHCRAGFVGARFQRQ
jgi:hypothetical protein